ncbi:hypothetical protein [Halobacterium litoreum]|uniref:Uncharacterized protein n=1 Tax=Halobacterium litoreum TaxID=2039234 RepID=A0ABD5NE06_9EURY|nr:hypothetical protein [Halobacterium litoreum]UHH13834.1 hypothetical protein LT972_02285 [Halobacterium litoreum]
MGDSGRIDALWRWATLTGDRRAVAGSLLAVFALLFGPIGHALSLEGGGFGHDTTVPLVTTLLSGNFLLVSIVVSVNSLFVSGEQNPLGQQFGRVRDTTEFRRQVEDVVEADHVPTHPESFLRVLTGDIVERGQRLQSRLPSYDVDVQADLDAYLESLGDATGEMNAALRGVSRPASVVVATMAFDYARQVDDLQRVRAEHADAMGDDAAETLDEMLELLEFFAVAREYFKTLYLRREFAGLSANLVYVSVPAIAVVSFVILHLSRLPTSHWLVVGVHVLSLAPFALLCSYVVRVAAVSRHTDSPGQFAFADGDGVPGVGDDR